MVTDGDQGRYGIFPHEKDIVYWIKDLRREYFPNKTPPVVQFIVQLYSSWCSSYLKANREDSLHRLVRRLVARHGFSFRLPSHSVITLEEMLREQVDFAATVEVTVAMTYDCACKLNADEMAVYYDESLGLIIAARGKSMDSKLKETKQSYRATVLLTEAAEGSKLPPLIIYKAKPDGTVEDSFHDYPDGAKYAVQVNA